MVRALIGSTGLVGSNLMRRAHFDDLYHRGNIETIAGKHYRLLVCAGAPAQKWLANREPAADRLNLERLKDALSRVQAEQVVLISTVDVFPTPIGVDECTPVDMAGQHPYGKHRYELEQFVAGRFAALIVRLPGLFGPGLKKNVIYDLLHQNEVAKIHPWSVYQFYALDWLWHDILVALGHNLNLIHFATEPLNVREVAAEAFGSELTNQPPCELTCYDFRSKFAAYYGGNDRYLYARPQVLEALRQFIQGERLRKS